MMAEYRIRPCPICQGTDYLKACGTESNFGDGRAAVFICKQCGMTPSFSTVENDVRELLTEKYYLPSGGFYSAKRSSEQESAYRAQVRANLLGVNAKHPLQGARLLDVGAGEGILLEIAAELGATPIGIEPSGLEVDKLKQRGFDMHRGLVEDFNVDDIGGPVDIVTLTWGLDCFVEPADALRRIRSFLKPTGLLHLALGSKYGLPLFRWKHGIPLPVQKPLRTMSPDRYTADIHPFYFSDRALETLLRVTGFELIDPIGATAMQPVVNARLAPPVDWRSLQVEDARRLQRHFRAWSLRDRYYNPLFHAAMKLVGRG